MINVVEQFRDEVSAAKKKLAQDLSGALRGLLDNVFEKLPNLTEIRWEQEEDVYNDETYEFEVSNRILIKMAGVEPDEDWDGFTEIEMWYRSQKKVFDDQYQILERFHTDLESIKDELEFVFGSATITATRDSRELTVEGFRR